MTSYLEGIVVDGNNRPISFAAVHTTGVDYTGASNTHTNDSGYFKIAVKSSSTAKIWANYYIISSTPRDEATPSTGLVRNIGTIVVPVDTANFCTITGRVVDNGGLPVLNASLIQKDATGKQIDYQSVSKDGRFKFFGETGLSYTIEVGWYADSSKHSTPIAVTCPSTPGNVDLGDIKLDLGGATVTGRVVDTNGNPLKDIWVFSPESSYNGSGGSRENRTDSTGVFSLWVRPNKTFTIRFSDTNQQSKSVPVTSGALGSTTNMGDVVFP
jgi:protocatechuate 3,4-dioxygenase beta subunit